MMTKHPKKETETQTRIRQLRDQINALDRDEVRPFTPYKIITYGCTVFFPLVPYALYRLGGAENGVFFQGTDSLESGHSRHRGVRSRFCAVGLLRLPAPLPFCCVTVVHNPVHHIQVLNLRGIYGKIAGSVFIFR